MDLKKVKIDFKDIIKRPDAVRKYLEATEKVMRYFNKGVMPISDIKIVEDRLMLKVHSCIASYMAELMVVNSVYLMPAGMPIANSGHLLQRITVPLVDPDKTVKDHKIHYIGYTLVIGIPIFEYLKRYYNAVNNGGVDLYTITMYTEYDIDNIIEKRSKPFNINDEDYSYIIIGLDSRRDYTLYNGISDMFNQCKLLNLPIVGISLPEDEEEVQNETS